MKTNWEQVGMIGVDAGLCWIGDPCYCVTPDATEHPAATWSEFCDKLFGSSEDVPKTRQWRYKRGHNGLGVSVETGYGDGTYPVYVKYNSEGRVAEVRVVFIGVEDE
jgi:hypothetical protein